MKEKQKNKKIAFVDNSLSALINFRGEVVETLAKEGYDITLIAPNDVEEMKFGENVKIIDVKLRRGRINVFENIKLFFDLLKIYRKYKFDIIFHYTIKPNIFGNFAAKICGSKSVAVIPGLGYTFISKFRFLIEIVYKYALKCTTEVWFINEDDKKLFQDKKLINKDKPVVVLSSEGINLNKFCPQEYVNDGKIKFLMIARVLWDKGFKEYVTAASMLKSKYPNLRFYLLGSIDTENPRGVPEEEIQKYCADGTIVYLGFVNEVIRAIKNSDCVVLPSYREGKGMVLIEASACERPIIATNAVGCKDVVVDGYNGYLCEVKNFVSLAEKFEKFINLTEEERVIMGRNGRKFVCDTFDISFVIDEYKKLMDRWGGGALSRVLSLLLLNSLFSKRYICKKDLIIAVKVICVLTTLNFIAIFLAKKLLISTNNKSVYY